MIVPNLKKFPAVMHEEYVVHSEVEEEKWFISPEQVLGSGSHAHLFVDLLVDASASVLQFTALSLRKRITPLHRQRQEVRKGKARNVWP